jgi:hypothetical protein
MKKLLLIITILGITACNSETQIMAPANIIDQCMRPKLFEQCMKLLPAGPVATQYNDWDEVVSECGRQAYYQSVRKREFVKPECRAE